MNFRELGKSYLNLKMRSLAMWTFAEGLMSEPDNKKLQSILIKTLRKTQGSKYARESIGEFMLFLKSHCFKPDTIIDVGINSGTPGLLDFYPLTKVLMFDPLPESKEYMKLIAENHKGNALYFNVGLGSYEGIKEFFVHPGYGGSRFKDLSTAPKDSTFINVPIRQLDTYYEEFKDSKSLVLKIDAEGAEIDILEGASKTLSVAEVVILETRIKKIGKMPVLLDLLKFMDSHDFAPFDLFDKNWNKQNYTLEQFDIVFVKNNGFFRTDGYSKNLNTLNEVNEEKRIADKLLKAKASMSQLKNS